MLNDGVNEYFINVILSTHMRILEEVSEDCMVRRFMVCRLHQIFELIGLVNNGELDGRNMLNAKYEGKTRLGRSRHTWEHEKLVINGIGNRLRAGFNWFKIGTSVWLF
jgi:hypothetical protein